ncbi:hypothetical protein AJ79_09559 [Helicocarpus griseus UAMH5409]|uniref:Uncharacterized protein n=1 Tax=Helicocarpus griseus UAMH5409 TaxID=1447875 RepID=A0A2B7WIY5_9EURO|nr:hypothetical protein AJ79_09559 [Helicocarpus griseus UAMH5409]
MDFIEHIEDLEEFEILSKLANNEADTKVDNALEQILDLSTAAHAARNPKVATGGAAQVDYNVSLALMELAQRLEPVQHHKLIEFVTKLQRQTAIDPSTGEPIKIQGETLWTELPSLAYVETETWREFGGNPCDEPTSPEMKPEQQRRWANANAFIAQLCQAADIRYGNSLGRIHPMDKCLRAIHTMQYALENEKNPPASLVGTAAMRAACMWFIYAADRLWANSRSGHAYPEICGAGSAGSNYAGRGWDGFTRDRWDVWESGLQEALAACSDEGEMKQLIGDALAHMKRAMSV